MKVSMEQKKVEALERMKKVGYWGNAREVFRRSGKVLVNEPPFGAVYEMEPELEETVKKFEAEHNALVYAVVRSFTSFGKMDSLLYVGDDEEEWEYDRADLDDKIAFSYTINYDMPDCSEFGSIGFQMGAGAGYVRVA